MNPLGEKNLPKRTDLQNDIDACLKWLHLLRQHINATRREKDMEKDEWLHIRDAATRMSGIAEKAEFAFDKEKRRQKMEVEEKRRKAQKAKEDKEAEDRRDRVLAADRADKDKRKKELEDTEKRKKQNPRNQVPAAHGKAPEPYRKGVHFQTPTPNSKGTPQERFDKAARDYNEACQQHTAAKQRYMQSSSSKNVKLRDAAMKREMVASAAYSEAHAGLARAKAKEREEKEEKEKMFMSPAARKRKDDNDRRQEEEDAKGKESARALASEVRKF